MAGAEPGEREQPAATGLVPDADNCLGAAARRLRRASAAAKPAKPHSLADDGSYGPGAGSARLHDTRPAKLLCAHAATATAADGGADLPASGTARAGGSAPLRLYTAPTNLHGPARPDRGLPAGALPANGSGSAALFPAAVGAAAGLSGRQLPAGSAGAQ